MASERGRMSIDLRGHLDQAGLTAVREALALERRGRLTDREDEKFGVRYLRGDLTAASLTLWRSADDRWRVSLRYSAADRVTREEIDEIVARVTEVAARVGLVVQSQRHVEPPPEQDFDTLNRNENWLRTFGWDLPAQTLDELWWVLGVAGADPDRRRLRLREFMTQPAWQAAPERIRQEAAEFLR